MNKFITDFIEGFKMAYGTMDYLNGTALGNLMGKLPESMGGGIAKEYPKSAAWAGVGLLGAALFGGNAVFNQNIRDNLTNNGYLPIGNIADWAAAYEALGKKPEYRDKVIGTPEYNEYAGTHDVLDDDTWENAAKTMTYLGYGGPQGTHNSHALRALDRYHRAGEVIPFFGNHRGALYSGSNALEILGNYVNDVNYAMERAVHGNPKYKEDFDFFTYAANNPNLSPSEKSRLYKAVQQWSNDRRLYPKYENDPVMREWVFMQTPEYKAGQTVKKVAQELVKQDDFVKKWIGE